MKFMIILLSSFVLLSPPISAHADRNVLWKKINDNCVPNYLQHNTYRPCSLIDLYRGIAIYKVDNDKFQYLLLPSNKITGIEDPKLLMDGTKNYFNEAWLARSFLTERIGKNIKENFISLTINPKNARTQDQLHIHLSCISNDFNKILSNLNKKNTAYDWSVNQTFVFSNYLFRYKKVSYSELVNTNLFKTIAKEVVREKGELKNTGAGLVKIGMNDFILFIAIGFGNNGISGEIVQDHACTLADKP